MNGNFLTEALEELKQIARNTAKLRDDGDGFDYDVDDVPDTHDFTILIRNEWGDRIDDFVVDARAHIDHPSDDIQLAFGRGGWPESGKYENVVYESRYTLTVSADGYRPHSQEITIDDDKQVIINLETADRDPDYAEGETERIDIGEGELNQMRPGKDLTDILGGRTDEAHMRYQVHFPEDFEYHPAGNPGGCKLPGFLNTTTGSATGGRASDGVSWSTRPATIRPNHPKSRDYAGDAEMKGLSQVYHLGATDLPHGEDMMWQVGWDRGDVVTLDQYVRLNDPDQSNGILRVWVDGELALDRTNIKFRDTVESDIERIWWGTYFGGTWGSPRDQYLELRNLEVWEGPSPKISES
ncbi:polysaccharide lyase [Halostagnicola sp. A-GB9-2]|uniref:polysaccharide lyase n=1 Tax=Halostagnicola sp. A-GB9-2 TaxID=3048066 RepID=UPI0024C0A451|nr:hypothetical protein [Halostagnicola sp. A-GB9-2]MDJ1433575.1 hypothetical protein [Halostagnicola sp. A-GB9-2]